MTFYNHIESLRGIAIDLTNGRKWRGASDKAAVFDALDAARREYMSLSDENAKLREEFDKMDVWHSKELTAVMAENAKLRELARGLHMAYVETLNECESMDEELIWECSGNIDADVAKSRAKFEVLRHRFDDALRELGIEEE